MPVDSEELQEDDFAEDDLEQDEVKSKPIPCRLSDEPASVEDAALSVETPSPILTASPLPLLRKKPMRMSKTTK